ncbi:MAG TPA: alpha/beta hydrolase [Parafilimonas sp.]|nr:alpha/beta hydrolase [Parafilimonas sp.]
MQYELKYLEKFKFVEEGEGETLILLHGLFGALSNFESIIDYFKTKYKVVVPMLPMFELDLLHTTVSGFAKYIHKFIEKKGYTDYHLLGNSLGGHIALVHILKHPEKIKSLILTGSSGLYESGMGDSYPRRRDYEYVKKKTEVTFYDPATATPQLIDEVYEMCNNRLQLIRILALAKSAIRNNLGEELGQIKQPTLLVWGNQDTVTPPFVAEEFHKLIPNSELKFIDKCGHAPMMEQPAEFNVILEAFLTKIKASAATLV